MQSQYRIFPYFFSFLVLSVGFGAHAQTQCPAPEDPTDLVPVEILESETRRAQDAFEEQRSIAKDKYLDELRKLVILVSAKQEALVKAREQLDLDEVSLSILDFQIFESLQNVVGAEEAGDLIADWKRGVTQEERDRIVNELAGKETSFQSLMADLAAQKNLSEKDFSKVNPASFKFSRVPAGELIVGSPDGSGRYLNTITGLYEALPEGYPAEKEKGREHDEAQRLVKVTEDYEIGKTEVTQLQYALLMGPTHGRFPDIRAWDYMEVNGVGLNASRPVTGLTWNEAQEFIRRLNELDPSYTYRLPTEAEWEKAARAGTTTAYSFGSRSQDLGDYVSEKIGESVASKKPNPLGLYDVHGNVWEWCQDGYCESPKDYEDPSGDESREYRVIRGGSWIGDTDELRSAARFGVTPEYRASFVGFRLVRTAK